MKGGCGTADRNFDAPHALIAAEEGRMCSTLLA
jgi:hypothetical protein